MSLRWTAYVASKPRRRGSKTQNGRFRSKSTLVSRKSATKFLYVKIVSDKVVRHLLASAQKWLIGTSPCTWKFGRNWPTSPKTPISIFVRSALAVTLCEKSSINTNRKSTMSFPMSLRWTVYIASKLPKGAQKRKVAVFRPTFENKICNNFQTARDRMSVSINH